MPTFEFTSPEGKTYELSGPEGSTKEQAFEKFKQIKPELFEDKNQTKEKPFGLKAIEFMEPSAEMLGTAVGGVLGTELGPPGIVGGGALGYAATKEAERLLKEKLGYQPAATSEQLVSQPLENVLMGGVYQTVPGALGTIGKGVKDVYKYATKSPDQRAAEIVSQSLGQNLSRAREVLKQASDEMTASQALSAIDPATGKAVLNAPTAQALLQRAQARDPEFFENLFGKQNAEKIKRLEKIAGGSNLTEAKIAQEQLKQELNNRLIPQLEIELNMANLGTQKLLKTQADKERFAEAAKQKVQDVRRFTEVQPRAVQKGRERLVQQGYPAAPIKYTYMGELAERAEKEAERAAEGSLTFGQASRFADQAKSQLAAYGIEKPLTSDQIISKIRTKLNDPTLAGNKDIELSLNQVMKDLKKWTNNKGIIDAWALDSIRKNSVNSVIQRLYPQASKASQKELASKVVAKIKPLIVDAVQEAGGTGYGQYLRDYSEGIQQINQVKLGERLLDLYKNNPNKFVSIIEGNKPEEIEDVFGHGSYDIFQEMNPQTMSQLKQMSNELKSQGFAEEQAKAGTTRLADVLGTNLDFIRLPHWLSKGTTLSNDVLARLEQKVSKDTLQRITMAARSAKSFDELLDKLPPKARAETKFRLKPSDFGGALAGTSDYVTQDEE